MENISEWSTLLKIIITVFGFISIVVVSTIIGLVIWDLIKWFFGMLVLLWELLFEKKKPLYHNPSYNKISVDESGVTTNMTTMIDPDMVKTHKGFTKDEVINFVQYVCADKGLLCTSRNFEDYFDEWSDMGYNWIIE